MMSVKALKITFAATALLGLGACAGGAYTGPVEVTRFAAPATSGLGQGTIALRFSEDLKNEAAIDAFRAAISDELSLQGYTIVDNPEVAGQVATISTSRSSLASATNGQNPVSVGVGAGTGTYGSGVGLGVGINLGSFGSSSPRVMSRLSVAISANDNPANRQNLWEARAQFPTSVNSPYAGLEANAKTLAAAIFSDFPGGNGETVSLKASDLVEP